MSDESSKIFAKNFYLALLCSRTVRQAFDIGQASVEAAPGAQRRGDASGAKFMLLPLGADHDVPVFGDAAPGRFLDETRRAPRNTCDTAVARLAALRLRLLLEISPRPSQVCASGCSRSSCPHESAARLRSP